MLEALAATCLQHLKNLCAKKFFSLSRLDSRETTIKSFADARMQLNKLPEMERESQTCNSSVNFQFTS